MTAERVEHATESMTPHRARLRFEKLPTAYCHPERISALLPEGLPAGFGDQLQASTRLRPRLSAFLLHHLALEAPTTDDLETPEGRFARLEGDDLDVAIYRIGAIWNARTLRRIILAEPLKKLVAKIGRDARRDAMRLRDLAAPEPDDAGESGETIDVDALCTRIKRDGVRAINAWCRHQPAVLAERLRLKLPPGPDADGELPSADQDRGTMIVDRVALMMIKDIKGTLPEKTDDKTPDAVPEATAQTADDMPLAGTDGDDG